MIKKFYICLTSKNNIMMKKSKKGFCGDGSGGAMYGLGFLGAVIYYISTATSFWGGVLGILKSFVWPAFLVFEVMKFLGA